MFNKAEASHTPLASVKRILLTTNYSLKSFCSALRDRTYSHPTTLFTQNKVWVITSYSVCLTVRREASVSLLLFSPAVPANEVIEPLSPCSHDPAVKSIEEQNKFRSLLNFTFVSFLGPVNVPLFLLYHCTLLFTGLSRDYGGPRSESRWDRQLHHVIRHPDASGHSYCLLHGGRYASKQRVPLEFQLEPSKCNSNSVASPIGLEAAGRIFASP
jgi:hypothetical protein